MAIVTQVLRTDQNDFKNRNPDEIYCYGYFAGLKENVIHLLNAERPEREQFYLFSSFFYLPQIISSSTGTLINVCSYRILYKYLDETPTDSKVEVLKKRKPTITRKRDRTSLLW